MVRKFLTALFLMAAFSPMAAHAFPTIVTGSASVKSAHIARGGHGVLTITLTVAPGYHIYTNPPSDKDLIPTVAAGVGAKGITYGAAHYPAGKSMSVSYKDKALKVYTGKTVITLPFTVSKNAKPGAVPVGGTVSYQGCNATSCYPPTSVSVKSSVTIQ